MAHAIENAEIAELEAAVLSGVPSVQSEECNRGKTEKHRKDYQELCSQRKATHGEACSKLGRRIAMTASSDQGAAARALGFIERG
jgi:hypothetical protein